MRKYLSKALIITCLILILIIAATSILVNNFLTASKSRIEQNISNLFNQKISIENISFLPPNFIILKNISIHQPSRSEQIPPISIQRLKCMFSLSKLIIKRDFVVSGIGFDNAILSYPFIEENIQEIIEAIQSLNQEYPLKLKIRKSRLGIPQEEKLMRWITLNATFAIVPSQSIFSSGSIFIPEFVPLDYSFQIFLTKQGFIVENLEFKSLPLYLTLWGSLEKNILTIHGSSMLNNLPDLDIGNLACVIKLDFPNLHIENLDFSLQNMPFRLKGAISLSESPVLSLEFSSFPNQPAGVRLSNPQAFDMKIAGTLLRKKEFNGKVSVDFLTKTTNRMSLQKAEIILENLAFFNAPDKKIKMSFDKADFSYVLGSNAGNVFLKDFAALLHHENMLIKFVKIDSIIYDGFLEGRGFLDISRVPFKNSFDINISDVSANRLHDLLSYCSKIYGDLSSQIHYRSYPSLKLTGKLLISDGVLDNIIFFNWVKDFLRIPSLNRINFDILSADFLVSDEAASLDNIHLRSKQVNFDGYFTLYKNDLVSSKLSLLFSERIIKRSPKLARLLNHLGKDTSSLGFDFQLSGFFQAINFKWLESDFKQRLQDLLPHRIERKLETDIEKIIESIAEK